MSRVFVAEETALGRKVVIKVLPPETAAQVSLERFKREIMLAAKLQHPHIVPLHSAGESNGLPYFTMPFVEGESLRVRLARHGELPVNDAIRILREIASALAYAHEHGIVHRDIKPDNMLLSGGSAMVTDFGVAKAVSASSNADHGGMTSLGVALGTPAYMSPEQATADPAIDHRADLYAFGVLAYELLTGQPPFAGRTPQNLLAAHVTEAPEGISRRRASLPPALAALVMRCLEKRPADRPQSAAEVVHALDDLTTPSGGMTPAGTQPLAAAARDPQRMNRQRALVAAAVVLALVSLGVLLVRRPGAGAAKSIAVLPFVNQSGDTAYDYFAEGMSDQLRTDLTNLRELEVKSRGSSSSSRFRGRDVDVHEAGTQLAVSQVVTGSVSRSGQLLHVTAELVNVADRNAAWSGNFNERLTDLTALQDSITRAIAGALKVNLASARGDTLVRGGLRGTADVDAYDSFLRGKYQWDRAAYPRAIPFFTAAVSKDPNFARAHADLATALALQPITGFGSRDSALTLARRSVSKAMALAPTLPEVALAQASVQLLEFNFTGADSTAARAVASSPGDPDLHSLRATTLAHLGHVQAAVAEAHRAVALDSLNPANLQGLQVFQFVAREYRAAITATQRILELDPGSTGVAANDVMGYAYLWLGKPDSAVTALEKALRGEPKSYIIRSDLAFAYAAAGRWPEARAQRATVEQTQGGNSPNFLRIAIHEAFGQMDSAMVDLERAVSAKEPLYLWWASAPCEPVFDPLKGNPRFGALMKQIGATLCPVSSRWPIPSPPK